MKYEKAIIIARSVQIELEEHCYHCEIAGSVRRMKEDVRDIEIVCVPKPFDTGLLAYGFGEVVEQWPLVRGKLTKDSKYTQRRLPQGIKLDIFIANPVNFGYILTLRTGHVDWVRSVLLPVLKQNGYYGKDGYLTQNNQVIPVPTEQKLFELAGLEFVEPKYRQRNVGFLTE